MTTNFTGPYQLRVFYNVGPGALPLLNHRMALNLDCDTAPDPGDAFSTIDIKRRVGAPVALHTVTNALADVLEDLVSAADGVISHAELWAYTPGTEDGAYISTHDLSTAGVHAGAGLPASQSVYSFRTTEGGVMYVVLLEVPDPGFDRQTYLNLSAAGQAFVDFFVDDSTSYWLGKDTSYPHVFLRHSPGINKATFNNRFRP